jgi:ABC-2 type transport system ATP-binding protein
MEEAEVLSDRLGIIDHGKFIAFGTPREIVDKYGTGSRCIVSQCDEKCVLVLNEQWPTLERKGGDVIIKLESKGSLPEILYALDRSGGNYDQIQVTRPTLEDVFLSLTGRNSRSRKRPTIIMARRRKGSGGRSRWRIGFSSP